MTALNVRLFVCVALFAALCTAVQVQATADPAATSGAVSSETSSAKKHANQANPTALNEVIVTATRHTESLLNVPISMDVLSGSSLEQPDVQSVVDALSRAPGVSLNVAGLGGASQVTIRGIASGAAQFTGSGTAAYYIDDTALGLVRSAVVPDVDAYDLQRVEVLEGPQGTLYGAGTLSGVVRILSNDPNLYSYQIKGRTLLSSTNGSSGANYDEDVALNAPIVPSKLALRAVASDTYQNGWIDSPVAKDINSLEEKTFRLKVLGKPPPLQILRERFGRIAFGHSELGGQTWTAGTIEGKRALTQILQVL